MPIILASFNNTYFISDLVLFSWYFRQISFHIFLISTEAKEQALLIALGYSDQIQGGVDENGNVIMVDNPVTKTEFIEQEVKSMLKERFANDEILNIEESYRQQIESEKKAVLDEIEANTTVNLLWK